MIRTYGAASSGVTSGFGFAIANTIGSLRMRASASGGITRAPERPMKRSIPSITSPGPPSSCSGFVCSAYQRFIAFIDPSR